MSKAALNKCDHCGATTSDYLGEPGWLSFGDGSVAIKRTVKRDKNGIAITDYLCGVQLEFCSVDCLIAKLDEQAAKRNGQAEPKPLTPKKEKEVPTSVFSKEEVLEMAMAGSAAMKLYAMDFNDGHLEAVKKLATTGHGMETYFPERVEAILKCRDAILEKRKNPNYLG